ncbi:hypothetical protein LAP8965_03141 [Lactiplantibacillus plantarum]|nr:hypothetical protein LAP8963_03078 [Lactiplantibacillus plantarum]SPE13630.1 hypothetical protein LAP8964_03025 [Lactiplantibacillus plantarum]SPH08357.1 hypothetical protein LAP8965_03141 [Lactiplantibacillus plantarum]SPH10885.1 hypothetical protein LAP8966_03099 [Lactiplantibacillus plantarum]
MFLRGDLYIIVPKMQHIVFYASFSMSYVFLYLIGLAQVISFFFTIYQKASLSYEKLSQQYYSATI